MTNPTLTHLSRLKEIARKATPGPWIHGHIADDESGCNCTSILSEGYAGGIATVIVGNGLPIGEGGNDGPPLEEAKANIIHIAAFSPEVAEAMIAVCDAAQLIAYAGHIERTEQIDRMRLLQNNLANLEKVFGDG